MESITTILTNHHQVATFKAVDKFSFPSGHATRATLLAALFTLLSPLPFLLWVPLAAWALAVAASRVLLGRHHLLDVLAGLTIGVVEAAVLAAVWRTPDQADAIVAAALGSEDPWSSG